jgi:putative endonuclease
MHRYHVYILASRGRVLYVGVTNDLERRVREHKAHLVPGFTQRYNVDRLVYFETTANVQAALAREKEIKGWRREKKVALIEAENPQGRDLAEGVDAG